MHESIFLIFYGQFYVILQIDEQAEQLASYKLREQELMDQIQKLQLHTEIEHQQEVKPDDSETGNSGSGTDRAIQDLCSQLETQHKQLIRQQITQLKHSLIQTPVTQPKMFVLDAHALGTHLSQGVSLQAYTNNNNSAPVDVTLNFTPGEEGGIQTNINQVHSTVEDENKVSDIDDKDDNYDKEENYATILVHSLSNELDEDNPVIENDGSIPVCDEPPEKKLRNK